MIAGVKWVKLSGVPVKLITEENEWFELYGQSREMEFAVPQILVQGWLS